MTALTKRILELLEKQIAFGGLTKRKTTDGEIILKCPVWATGATLEPLASDLTGVFINYIAEATTAQVKSIIKEILE